MVRVYMIFFLVFIPRSVLVSTGGVVSIRFIRFHNPTSRDHNNECCEFSLASSCDSQCDTYVKICVDEIPSIGNCKYGGRIQSKVHHDSDEIVFGSFIGSATNPITFTFDKWQAGVSITVESVDQDEWYEGSHDPLDTITIQLDHQPEQDGMIKLHRKTFSGQRSTVEIEYKITCGPHYFRDCSVYCIPDLQRYTCDVTGSKICLPGWTGVDCTTDVDDCVDHVCEHGGQCVDGLRGYSCHCKEGFTGLVCENSMGTLFTSDTNKTNQITTTQDISNNRTTEHKQLTASGITGDIFSPITDLAVSETDRSDSETVELTTGDGSSATSGYETPAKFTSETTNPVTRSIVFYSTTEKGGYSNSTTEIGGSTDSTTESGDSSDSTTESGDSSDSTTESGDSSDSTTESGDSSDSTTESGGSTDSTTESGGYSDSTTERGSYSDITTVGVSLSTLTDIVLSTDSPDPDYTSPSFQTDVGITSKIEMETHKESYQSTYSEVSSITSQGTVTYGMKFVSSSGFPQDKISSTVDSIFIESELSTDVEMTHSSTDDKGGLQTETISDEITTNSDVLEISTNSLIENFSGIDTTVSARTYSQDHHFSSNTESATEDFTEVVSSSTESLPASTPYGFHTSSDDDMNIAWLTSDRSSTNEPSIDDRTTGNDINLQITTTSDIDNGNHYEISTKVQTDPGNTPDATYSTVTEITSDAKTKTSGIMSALLSSPSNPTTIADGMKSSPVSQTATKFVYVSTMSPETTEPRTSPLSTVKQDISSSTATTQSFSRMDVETTALSRETTWSSGSTDEMTLKAVVSTDRFSYTDDSLPTTNKPIATSEYPITPPSTSATIRPCTLNVTKYNIGFRVVYSIGLTRDPAQIKLDVEKLLTDTGYKINKTFINVTTQNFDGSPITNIILQDDSLNVETVDEVARKLCIDTSTELAMRQISTQTPSSGSGGVIGGVIAACLYLSTIFVIGFLLVRRKYKEQNRVSDRSLSGISDDTRITELASRPGSNKTPVGHSESHV